MPFPIDIVDPSTITVAFYRRRDDGSAWAFIVEGMVIRKILRLKSDEQIGAPPKMLDWAMADDGTNVDVAAFEKVGGCWRIFGPKAPPLRRGIHVDEREHFTKLRRPPFDGQRFLPAAAGFYAR